MADQLTGAPVAPTTPTETAPEASVETKAAHDTTQPIAATPEAPGDQPEASPEEPAKKEEPQSFSKQMKALQRYEDKLVAREEKVTEQEREVSSYRAEREKFNTAIKQAQSDPLGFLQAAGITETVILNALLGGTAQKQDPVKTLETRLEKLEREKQELEQKAKRQQEDQQIKSVLGQIAEFTKKSGEYPLVDVTNNHQAVLQYMSDYYRKYHEEVDVDSASHAVEEFITKKYEEVPEDDRPVKINRILERKKSGQSNALQSGPNINNADESPAKNKDSGRPTPLKTSSNNLTSAPGKQIKEPTPEERVQQAKQLARQLLQGR